MTSDKLLFKNPPPQYKPDRKTVFGEQTEINITVKCLIVVQNTPESRPLACPVLGCVGRHTSVYRRSRNCKYVS